MSANDNVHKEEENACGVVLSELGNTKKKIDERISGFSKIKVSKPIQPNNSSSLSTDYSNQDIEIEDKESYQLKQSLGI